MVRTCSSAEITAPRALGACVPYSASIVLWSTHFRRVCRAVSLSTEGLLVLSTHVLPRGQLLKVSLPLPDDLHLELVAVVAYESSYLGQRALDIRFVNLGRRDQVLLAGLVSDKSRGEVYRGEVKKPKPAAGPSTTIAPPAEFDGLPSTNEIDEMLARTLQDLKAPTAAKKKKRKRFLW
ncbi:MAG: PilZ domain-containing protein [Deltaproteobacteria bacterium]|nr:PilZ domain-containing protein [Deltaproteobacteria bacterium]